MFWNLYIFLKYINFYDLHTSFLKSIVVIMMNMYTFWWTKHKELLLTMAQYFTVIITQSFQFRCYKMEGTNFYGTAQ